MLLVRHVCLCVNLPQWFDFLEGMGASRKCAAKGAFCEWGRGLLNVWGC